MRRSATIVDYTGPTKRAGRIFTECLLTFAFVDQFVSIMAQGGMGLGVCAML